MGAYYDLNKQILIEKSPANLIRSRFIQKLFPGSMFVLIVRQPITESLAKEKWSKRTNMERLLHWHTAHTILLEDLKDLKHYRVIRYEDMVKDGQGTINTVFELANISTLSPNESFQDHNERYFNQWIDSSAFDIDILKSVLCGDVDR